MPACVAQCAGILEDSCCSLYINPSPSPQHRRPHPISTHSTLRDISAVSQVVSVAVCVWMCVYLCVCAYMIYMWAGSTLPADAPFNGVFLLQTHTNVYFKPFHLYQQFSLLVIPCKYAALISGWHGLMCKKEIHIRRKNYIKSISCNLQSKDYSCRVCFVL